MSSPLARQLTRSQRLHGTHFGAIDIATKDTATSRRSVFLCSCTSTHTRGSIIETGVKRRATALTTSKTQSPQRSLIVPSASTSRTSSAPLDQTSGASLLLTARKAIWHGVVHRAIRTSMELSCLQQLVAH